MGDPDQQRFVLLAQRFEDVVHPGAHRQHSIREAAVFWDARWSRSRPRARHPRRAAVKKEHLARWKLLRRRNEAATSGVCGTQDVLRLDVSADKRTIPRRARDAAAARGAPRRAAARP